MKNFFTYVALLNLFDSKENFGNNFIPIYYGNSEVYEQYRANEGDNMRRESLYFPIIQVDEKTQYVYDLEKVFTGYDNINDKKMRLEIKEAMGILKNFIHDEELGVLP